jgi:hypothetical protein
MDQKPLTAVLESAHRDRLENPPFDGTRDSDDADRGFIGALELCVGKTADGRMVWDNDVYTFLDGDIPTTVHCSLWRQSQLCAKHGLYGIYQVRGFALSNIHFIEGDTGDIVIDPQISTETAAPALAFYRATAAAGPSSPSSDTHSHADHFGRLHPTRVVLALECAADEPVAVDASGAVALHLQATAAQVFDYWWSGRIPDVRNRGSARAGAEASGKCLGPPRQQANHSLDLRL